MIFMGNQWKIVLTLFSGCGNRYLSPHRRGILKKMRYLPKKVDEKFSLVTGEMKRGGQGDAPLGLPPRWGREGVTLIPSSKCKKIWAATGFLQSRKYMEK